MSKNSIAPGYPGKFAEDFKKGQIIKHKLGRTVSQQDNVLFTLLALNTAPLHFDYEYAREHQMSQPIGVTSMIVSILSGLSSEDISMNLAQEIKMWDLKLLSSVRDGDTLHAESEILDIRDFEGHDDRKIITVKTKGFKNESRTLVCEFTREMAIYNKRNSPRWQIETQKDVPIE